MRSSFLLALVISLACTALSVSGLIERGGELDHIRLMIFGAALYHQFRFLYGAEKPATANRPG